MKALLIAAGIIAVSASAVSAQFYPSDRGYRDRDRGHRYERYERYERHESCGEAHARVRRYYRDAIRWDGHVDQGERVVLHQLERRAAAACRGRRF